MDSSVKWSGKRSDKSRIHKLPKNIYQFTEGELFRYMIYKKKVVQYEKGIYYSPEKLKDEVYYATIRYGEERVQGGKIAREDPIGDVVVKLLMPTSRITHLQNFVDVVDNVIRGLGEEYKLIFWKYYCEKLSREMVCMDIPTTRATFYRKKDYIVYLVAVSMGWYSAEEQ